MREVRWWEQQEISLLQCRRECWIWNDRESSPAIHCKSEVDSYESLFPTSNLNASQWICLASLWTSQTPTAGDLTDSDEKVIVHCVCCHTAVMPGVLMSVTSDFNDHSTPLSHAGSRFFFWILNTTESSISIWQGEQSKTTEWILWAGSSCPKRLHLYIYIFWKINYD